MTRAFKTGVWSGVTFLLTTGVVSAHVSVASGPGYADKTQEVTFGVGHGCEGTDTLSVRIEIPPEVTSVRAVSGDFGPATVEKDDAGLVTAVRWEKPQESVLDADTNYYKLTLRLRVPNQPFTTVYFPALQTCQAADGSTIEVPWVSTDPNATDVEPAPALAILPAHFTGWNKYTVPAGMPDVSVFFSDALIVWKDDAAYSANPNTAELILDTPGVTALTALRANDEIWVKY